MDSYFRARDILDKAMGTDSYFQIKSILLGLKAADVVEVVRCRECKHGKRGVDNMVRCYHPCGKVISMTAGDFCSYGQRKIETVLPINDAKDESLEADHETQK